MACSHASYGVRNCPIAIFDRENKRFRRREFDCNRAAAFATYYSNAAGYPYCAAVCSVRLSRVSPDQNKPLPIRYLPSSARWLSSCLVAISSTGCGKRTRNGRTQDGKSCTSSQVDERGLPWNRLPGFLRRFDGSDRVSESKRSSPEECDSPTFPRAAARERCERRGGRTSGRPKWSAISWRLPLRIVISVIPG